LVDWLVGWCLRGQYFIFGALCPSKSGLMNKHIVKHIVLAGKHIVKHIVHLMGLAGSMYALCPSKSGLMNKHTGIVKHIVEATQMMRG